MSYSFDELKKLLVSLGYDNNIDEGTNIVNDEELDSTEVSELISKIKMQFKVFVTPLILESKTLGEVLNFINKESNS